MNRLEARLSKLESINTEAPVIRIMNDFERAARLLYIFDNPHKFDPNVTSRLAEILYKHLPLKGDK